MNTPQLPIRIHSSASQRTLTLHWAAGEVTQLSHAQLRARCPCAQCRAGRLRGRIDVVDGQVRITAINSQGYGLQLVFDDGHENGIYPWDYLRELHGSGGAGLVTPAG